MKPLAQLSKKQTGYLEGIVSIILNTALFAVKFWVGAVNDSIAMQADAWHTLSDTLTSVVVIVGFWISSRPADKEHPYGHGRAELVASVVIGTLLVVVGFTFGYESVRRLIERQTASFTAVAIVVFVVSVIAKEALAQFSYRLGRRINSTALKADGWHHRSDAIASGLIVVGALFGQYLWWIDGVLGIGVSLLILYAAFTIVWENAKAIMGESLSQERREEIARFVTGCSSDISDIHHFHVHTYGEHTELTFHLRMKKNLDVECAHRISSEIESVLKQKFGYDATIHIEPERWENTRA